MDFVKQRKQLIGHLVNSGYIKSDKVKRAMLKVPRENFVLPEYKDEAYVDIALPIVGGATISQPLVHAATLEALQIKDGEKVLEVGAGSGIVLAYLKELVGPRGKIFGVEISKEVFDFAKKNLKKTGYFDKVTLINADGSKGLPEQAPFDKIVVSAAAGEIPKKPIDQLKPEGVMVIPLGASPDYQELVLVKKTRDKKLVKENLMGVVFMQLQEK